MNRLRLALGPPLDDMSQESRYYRRTLAGPYTPQISIVGFSATAQTPRKIGASIPWRRRIHIIRLG